MRRRDAASLALATVALALAAVPSLGTTVDDAWITARYADHLVAGHGLVYNAAGSAVEGITNPAWALWVAVGLALGAPPFGWLEGSGLFAALLLPALSFAAARTLDPTPRGAHHGAPWAVALSPHIAIVASNGLETAAWLAGLLGAGLAVHHARRPSTRALTGLGLAALGALRPEGYLVGGLLTLAALVRDGRAALALALPAAAGVGLTELGRLATYGAWLPNTFAAKAGAHGTVNLRYLGYDGVMWPLLWATAPLAAGSVRRQGPALLVLALGAALTVVALQVNLWMPGARLLLPGGLAAVVLVAAARGPTGAALRGLGMVGLAVLHLSDVPAHARRYDRIHSVRPANPAQRAALHLAHHLPAGSVVVTRDAGVVPFWLGVDTHVVETHQRALTLPHPEGAPTDLAAHVPRRPEAWIGTVAGADDPFPAYRNDRWVAGWVRGRYSDLGRVRQHHRRHYDVHVREALGVPPLPPEIVLDPAP